MMMKPLRRLAFSLATASLAAAAPARAACLEPVEAEGLLLTLAPRAMTAIGTLCRDRLPATSLLVRPDSPLIARYQAELATAAPAANRAVGKVGGKDARALMDDAGSREMFYDGLITELMGDVKVASCGQIDRALTLLEPLPPRNAAALVVFILEASPSKERGKAKSDFDICPGTLAEVQP